MRTAASLALTALLFSSGTAMAAAGAKPEAVLKSKGYEKAAEILSRDHDRLVAEIVKLTEIPAPPFKEAARAAAYRDMLVEAGLTDVETDPDLWSDRLAMGRIGPGQRIAGIVPDKEGGAQCIEQRRLAHFIGLDDDV